MFCWYFADFFSWFFFPLITCVTFFLCEDDSSPGTVSLSQVGLRQGWASHPKPPPVAVSGISWAVIADLCCNFINKDFGRLIKMMTYSKTSIEIVSEFQKESSQWNEQKASETKMAGCGLGAAASLGASLEPNAAAVWYECVFSPWLLNNFQFFFIMTSFRFLAVLLDCQYISLASTKFFDWLVWQLQGFFCLVMDLTGCRSVPGLGWLCFVFFVYFFFLGFFFKTFLKNNNNKSFSEFLFFLFPELTLGSLQ